MDAANGNAGAAPAAAAPAAAAPAAAVVGGANQRLRFHVELTPGETTVVSWKQLMRDAGNEVSDDSSEETDSTFSLVKIAKKGPHSAAINHKRSFKKRKL